ncbi:MAG: DUF6338 family protein, partial [Rhizobiaceae bacterium]
LAAWVFYGLSAYEKPSQFERVVQAFIFTLAVQFFVSLFGIIYPFEKFDGDKGANFTIYIETVVSVVFAFLVGFSFAVIANKDWIHKILRKLNLTEQTSYPSEWFGVLTTQKTYIVLHLHDERRLYGWPKEWPQTSEKGHFLIIQASWIEENGQEIYLGDKGVDGILIAVSEVKWVEFIGGIEKNG